jgi:hypothetical protein
MIIKITSNTSRTSINGTTFISTKIPRFEPPTDMLMSHLVGKIPARRTLTSERANYERLFRKADLKNSIDQPLAWR